MTGPPIRVNPFEPQKKRANPFINQVETPDTHTENPNNEPGFLNELGNTTSYLLKSLPELAKRINPIANIATRDNSLDVQAMGKVGSDVLDFSKNLNFSPTNPLVQGVLKAGSSILDGVKQNPLGLPAMVAKGGLSMLKTPIDVLNQTHDENGIVIPNSPEQQADAIKSSIALVVQGAATSKMAAMLSPELGAEAQVAFASKSRVGRLISTIPKSVAANAVGGASQGMISHMGKEDQVAAVIAEGLAFAPIGILFGGLEGFKIPKVDKAIEDLKGKSAGELASLRAMQIDGKSTLTDISTKIDQFATADDYTVAAVKSNLSQGKGFILDEKVHDIDKVKEQIASSDKNHEGVFDPSANPIVAKKIRLSRTNVGGSFPRWLNFKDPFDKAVFLAGDSRTKGGLSPSQILVREEIKSQLDLTDAEIDSHRDAIKQYYKTEGEKNLKQLSQPEIDRMNNEIVSKGGDKLLSTLDGTQFKDNTGKIWTKKGSFITDGQQTLDINSNLAKQIAGRKPSQVEPTAPVIEIPKQNFQPNFGRETLDFHAYEGMGGVHYLSPEKLNQETQNFFKSTGFLPNEIVSINGIDHIVRGESKNGNLKVENISTGKLSFKSMDPGNVSSILRKATGLESEIYKAENGEQIARTGILNRDSFYRSLFDKFQRTYDLEDVGEDSYTNSILKFANEIGMKNEGDIQMLGKEFQKQIHSKIEETLGDDGFENDFKYVVNLKKGVEAFDKYVEENDLTKTNHAFDTNNMYLKADGNGAYSIKDLASTKTLAKVSSYQEALEFVNKSRQSNGLDLDGGDSNVVPPGSANNGASGTGRTSTPFTPSEPSRLDVWNVGALSKFLAPIQAQMKSVDNLNIAKGTQFFKFTRALQTAQGVFKNTAMTDFKPVSEAFNKVADLLKKIPENRHNIVSDYLETHSLAELIQDTKPDEVKTARTLAGKDISSIISYLSEIRESDAKMGTPEFGLKAQEVASKLSQSNTPVYDPETVKIANQLITNTDPTSLYKILRYAKALDNPTGAISRSDFAARNKMTKDELQLAKHFDETLDKGHSVFNLQKGIRAYLPNVELANAAGYNAWGDTPFGKEFARLAIDKNSGSLERNPVMLLRKFIISGSRTMPMVQTSVAFPGEIGPLLSFNDIVKKASDYAKTLEQDDALRPYLNTFNDHIADIRGIPDNSELMARAADKYFKDIYGHARWDKSKAAILVSHAALLGGRLALTLRDVKNGWENVANRYSYGLAFKMLSESVDREYALQLRAKGILPSETGLDLLMPGEDIHTGMARISKIADGTMKWNGNLLAHQQMLAGLYKASIKEVGKASSDLLNKDEKIRDKAFKNLKLQTEDPIIQKQFANLIEVGKTQEAADLLARERTKMQLNHFGQHNNPIGWENRFGRLAGGMMSWGVNQAQTMASGLMRGSRMDRLTYASKLTAHNAITASAGYYAGVNLLGWTLSPFSLIGQSPIVNAALGSMKTINNIISPSPDQRGQAENSLMNFVPHNDHTIAQLYLPYSYKLQEFIDGIEEAQNDYGPVAAGAKIAGIGSTLPFRSNLQKEEGNHPRDITTGKRVTDNKLTGIEKKVFR